MRHPRRLPPSARALAARGLFTAALAFLAIPVSAQIPELAGSWQMDTERSEKPRQGPMFVSTYHLELVGDDVDVRRVFHFQEGDFPLEYTLVTDGKPHDLPAGRGQVRQTRSKWRKKGLHVAYTLSRGPLELDVQESWTLEKGELVIRYSTRLPNDRQMVRKEYYRRMPGT